MGVRAFKFRLYPTRAQAATLAYHLRLHRELYNGALQERRDAYSKCGKSVTAYEQIMSLPEVKDVRPEFKELSAQSLQATLRRLDKAFQGFFRRVKQGVKAGYPRFQGRDRFDSFQYPQVWRDGKWTGGGKPVDDGRKVYLPKIGNVRLKMHRAMEGIPKTLTIKREGEAWYAIYACEVADAPLPATGSVVGFDLGTNPNFLITSDGEFVHAPRFFQQSQAKLRRAQRVVARKKRGSNRQRKARRRVATVHRKAANQRLNFHHQTARTLVNQHDAIFHEDLNIIGLARTRTAKGVLDAGWAQFLDILNAKAESAGRLVRGVKPEYTSQDCHVCNHRQKVPIGKPYICLACGQESNRDVNAAKNILRSGLLMRVRSDRLARGLDGAFGEGHGVAHAH